MADSIKDPKMEKDFSAQVDVALPQAEALAKVIFFFLTDSILL
jgi:hypothetical protein